jgi:CS domain
VKRRGMQEGDAAAANNNQGESRCRIVPHPANPLKFSFQYNGSTVYDFEQSLSEVILYIAAPPQNPVVCNISPNHVQLGLKGGSQFFLDEDTFATVDTADSTWCYEDEDEFDDSADNDHHPGRNKRIVIYLQKSAKGLVWPCALLSKHGNATLNPSSLQLVQKQIMIDRWQEEHPGMDFRDAEFNGNVPDPRTFMGGVRYS